MDRNAFFNLIKENRLSSAYLLHGVEEYVKDSAVSALLETVEEATRPLNVDTLESAEANALTLPRIRTQRPFSPIFQKCRKQRSCFSCCAARRI